MVKMIKQKNIHYCKKECTLCSQNEGSKECTPLSETGHCKHSIVTLTYLYEKLEKEITHRLEVMQNLSKEKETISKKATPIPEDNT